MLVLAAVKLENTQEVKTSNSIKQSGKRPSVQWHKCPQSTWLIGAHSHTHIQIVPKSI